MRSVHRAPATVEGAVMSADHPLDQSKRRPLPARAFLLASGGLRFARLRVRSVHYRSSSSLNCRVGSELAHFARLGNVTAFLRYAERMGSALSVTRRHEYALCRVRTSQCASVQQAAPSCRLSSNQHLEPRRGQPVGALAASFWRRGTQRRTDDNALRPALHEAGLGWFLENGLRVQRNLFSEQTFRG